MWNDYDLAMIDDPLLLLQRLFSVAVASSTIAGTRGSELEITETGTGFTIGVGVNTFAIVLDIAVTLLSIVAPATRAWAKQTLEWEHAAIKQIVRDRKGQPVKTLTSDDLLAPAALTAAGDLLDLYNCLATAHGAGKNRGLADMLDMARDCISSIFDSAVSDVASGVLASLKVAPEAHDLIAHGQDTATITVRPPNVQADLGAALPGPGGPFGAVTGDPTAVCCHGAFPLPDRSCSSTPDRRWFQAPDESKYQPVGRSYRGRTPRNAEMTIDVGLEAVTPATEPVLVDYLRRTNRNCRIVDEESPINRDGSYTVRHLPTDAGVVAVALDYRPDGGNYTEGEIWIYGAGVLVSVVTRTDRAVTDKDRHAAENDVVSEIAGRLRDLGWAG
jgi:hypothetical protein